MAYPQQAEEIEELDTAAVELTSEADENVAEEDDLGLDDLDSSFGDFLTEDEEDESTALSSETEGSELELANFDENLEAGTELESDDLFEETSDELEFDLDLDQDDDAELEMKGAKAAGDDLPDLGNFEDFAELDDNDLSPDGSDSELEDIELELEPNAVADLKPDAKDEANVTDLQIEDADELDLSDLELSLDNDSDSEDTIAAAPAESSADLATDNQAGEKNIPTSLNVEEADELDLSDLDLEIDDAPVAEETTNAGSDDINLDLDLDLETENIDDGTDPKPALSIADADELDLSDLTDMLEDKTESATESQPEDLELELATDVSGESDRLSAVANPAENNELNVSDLEELIDSESASAAQPAAKDDSQNIAMDLDFQVDDETQSGDSAAVSENEDELDFSDLEQMLESDEGPTVETTGDKGAEELDLKPDRNGSTADDNAMAAAEKSSEEAGDDDFLDIEQMLEDGNDNGPPQANELAGEVTELPLEMEAALDDASKGADAELELDFDLESELQEKDDLFNNNEASDQQLESSLLVSDEVDFLDDDGSKESEMIDGPETSDISTDEFTSDGFSDTNNAYGATQALAATEKRPLDQEAFEAETTAKEPKKARSKKPVLVTLLIFLLAVGVIIVPNMLGIKIPYLSDIKIPYLSDLDIKIPYLSDWLNPEEQDVAGNLKIVPLGHTINGKFVDNSQAGQLFVIRGKIRNDYNHPRSYIKVTGKLYQKGARFAKQATVYCGNMLPPSDLAAMDIASINKHLGNKSGHKKSNFKVQTGRTVPFMIVFDKLPRNLDEYTVEVEGSSI